MKARADSAELSEALAWADKAVGSKTMMPALSGMVVQADEGKLTFKTCDIENSASVAIPAAIDEPGAVLAPRRLAALARKLHGQVALEASDDLHVSCGRVNATLGLLRLEDFPRLPTVEGEPVELGSFLLERVGKHVAPFCAKQSDRLALQGIGLEAGDGRIVFAASDGYRFQKLQRSIDADVTLQAVVPPSLFAAGFDGPMALEVGEGHAGLSDADRRITTALIEATYPTMPDPQGGVEVTLERDELLESLGLLATVSAVQPVAELSLDGDLLHLRGGEGSDAVADAVACVASEDAWQVHVNPAFLASMVKTHQAETVTVSQDGHMRPLTITSDDEGLTSVVMPVRAKG